LRVIRLSAFAFVWLCGLGAGFICLLVVTAWYGCAAHDSGIACHTTGSVLGAVLLVTVISIVIVVTVLGSTRPARQLFGISGAGVAALALCVIAARSLLATA
jgi:hypothetical protein